MARRLGAGEVGGEMRSMLPLGAPRAGDAMGASFVTRRGTKNSTKVGSRWGE